MARTFDEEKRLELINRVGKYFLYSKERPSCRGCVKYLKDNGISISSTTVQDYLHRFIRMNPSVADIIYEIIDGNKPKTVEDENIKNRVLMVSNMIGNGLNVEDVVNKTGYTKDIIYNDITKRIFLLDVDLGLKVKEVLETHRLENLMHGNDDYLNNERNEDGTFKK